LLAERTGNNGNLLTQTISAPGLNLTQTYTYDPLNRLQSATETPSSWYQTYGYTASGNQYIVPGQSDNFSVSNYAAQASTNFNAQNQLTSAVENAAFDPSGNGNQTAIGPYSYTWDAEGRITSSTLSGIITAYVYDGEGQRVQKITCPANTVTCTASVSGALVTTYVYDAAGNLAAEYGAPESGQTTDCGTSYCYVSVDQLGSTRLVTDSNGNVVKRYDFLPFGQEAWAGQEWGGRTSAMGYQSTADGFNPKFTGQQRDPESMLDYFHARYYAPYQGRFVSPDPGNAGADMSDPQTWNGYSYVGNNPLNYTDPTGLGFGDFLDSVIFDILDAATAGIWGAITAAVNGTQPGPGPVLGIGSDIFGSIAGSVNNGQPWNEQWSIAGGGSLNTGSVFGGGDTGPFINNILQPAGGNPGDVIFYDQAIAYLQRDPTMARIIRRLRRSRRVYAVSFIGNGNDSYLRGRVSWDPTSSLQLVPGGACQSAALGLGHELAHAYEEDLYPYWYAREHGIRSPAYLDQVERWAIIGPETSAARTLGEPTRQNHDGNAMREQNTTARTCRVPIP
jgi:RHS repeat-associated protein